MTRLIGTIPVMVFVGVAVGFAQDSNGGDAMHPRVKMETTLGDFVLELDGEKAPITVLNFVQYVQDKYYDGTIFHRVMPNFMIQAGGFNPEMDKKSDGLRSPIKNEWKNGLKNITGTIAMARTQSPDSATSQFYINVVDNPNLDSPRGGAAYCVFVKVVEGMDVIEKIRNTPVETHPKYGGGRSAVVPVEPVVFKSARVVGEFDRKKLESSIKDVEKQAKELETKVAAERIEKMKEYVAKIEKETGKKAVTTSSGLAYVVLTEGDGVTPKPTDRVEVHYTGWLLDGSKFDSSVDRGTPSKFPLNGVIKGWTEGLGLMKVGSKHKLIIPSELGYGKRGSGARIPPDSTLVFDVELISIVE